MLLIASMDFKKHPHRRGEDFADQPVIDLNLETPPQAWGGLIFCLTTLKASRNTPTGVGRTPLRIILLILIEKHPHRRGEDQEGKNKMSINKETPPQAWGGPKRPDGHEAPGRNTPTGVGRTQYFSMVRLPSETPPQAWGGQKQIKDGFAHVRNTPTGVGRTLQSPFPRR